jgi:hypothetical protein
MRAEASCGPPLPPFFEQPKADKEVYHENRTKGTLGTDADLCRAGLLLLRWSRVRHLLDDGPQRHDGWHNDATANHDAVTSEAPAQY